MPMHHFRYVKGRLHCEGSSIEALVEQYGSPLYVYSSQTLSDHYTRLSQSLSELDHSICYAVKANSNLGVLHTLAKLGSGFDTVSQGELMRVKAAGGQLNQCVFAGVGKTAEEIRYALKQGIYAFNVESLPELERIHAVAKRASARKPPLPSGSIPTWMPRPTPKSPQALTKTNSGSLLRRSRHSMPKCPRCLTCICGAFKCISVPS